MSGIKSRCLPCWLLPVTWPTIQTHDQFQSFWCFVYCVLFGFFFFEPLFGLQSETNGEDITNRFNQKLNYKTIQFLINFLQPDYLCEIEEYLKTTLQEEKLTPCAQIRRRYLLDRFYALELGANDGRNPLGWSGSCP